MRGYSFKVAHFYFRYYSECLNRVVKNFLETFLKQVAAALVTIATGVMLLCLIGLFFAKERDDLFIILSIAALVFIVSFGYLRYRKVTWEEYVDLPW